MIKREAVECFLCDLAARKYFSATSNHHLFQRNILPGGGQPLSDDGVKAGAAGNFHDHRSDAFYAAVPADLLELVDIALAVHIIKLGAAHHYGVTFQQLLMQIRICRRYAIGQNQKVRAIEEGLVHWRVGARNIRLTTPFLYVQ